MVAFVKIKDLTPFDFLQRCTESKNRGLSPILLLHLIHLTWPVGADKYVLSEDNWSAPAASLER